MEMAQDADSIPPHIDPDDIEVVSAILTDWIYQLQSEENADLAGSRQIIVSAIACAYLAGQLTTAQVNQTHRSENGNTYYIYNYFG